MMDKHSQFETSSLIPSDGEDNRRGNVDPLSVESSPRNNKRWGLVAVAMIVLIVGLRVAFASPLSSSSYEEKGQTISSSVVAPAEIELVGKKNRSFCEDGGYSKRTLKMAYELPFHSLFKDTKGQKKFEASSVIVNKDDGFAYAICDSSWAISKFGDDLLPFASHNLQVGDPYREKEDSGYEALFEDGGSFYVVRESIQHEDSTYHAVIEQLSLSETDYEVVEQCSAEFEFEGTMNSEEMCFCDFCVVFSPLCLF